LWLRGIREYSKVGGAGYSVGHAWRVPELQGRKITAECAEKGEKINTENTEKAGEIPAWGGAGRMTMLND
jgi:hypothetical protein